MTALGVCIVVGLWCGVLFIGGAISDFIAYRLFGPAPVRNSGRKSRKMSVEIPVKPHKCRSGWRAEKEGRTVIRRKIGDLVEGLLCWLRKPDFPGGVMVMYIQKNSIVLRKDGKTA